MTDTWITPRIWVTSERVGQSKMNEISNNLRVIYPYTTAGDIAKRSASGDYLERIPIGSIPGLLHAYGQFYGNSIRTTSSTSLTDVSAFSITLSLSVTCSIYAFFYGVCNTDNGAQEPTFAFSIDGTDDPGPLVAHKSATPFPVNSFYYRTGILAGSRIVKLRYKIATSADVINLQNGKIYAFAYVE